MPFSLTTTPGRLVLTLEGAATVEDAQALAVALRDRLEDGAVVDVDTGGLEVIDTAILQILVALRQGAPSVSFEPPSAAFVAMVDRCGLRRHLLDGRGAA